VSARAAAAGAIWGSAPFERIAVGASASHEAVMRALDLAPGTRMLDVASGTGAVALRAAERGAVVTAVDISPQLLERARTAAREAGLAIEFRTADAQRLPFAPGSFDAIASAQGAVFAPDREAVAHELARVCRPGGSLGLTCPIAAEFPFELARILASFRTGAREAWLRHFAWGDPAEVDRLLGGEFALHFEELAAPFRVATPREGWDVYSKSFGPLADLVQSLGLAGRAELRARVLELLRRYVTPAGVVAHRPLLLVVGRRRLRV
jgi:SAM-dependent methyltransferase